MSKPNLTWNVDDNPKTANRGLFGGFFSNSNNQPRSQSNNSSNTPKENLRSLMITFNHTNKTDEDKIKNINVILDKIKLYFSSGSLQTNMTECQLDFKSTIQLMMKSIQFNNPNDDKSLTMQFLKKNFDTFSKVIECLKTFISSTHEPIVPLLDQFKVQQFFCNLARQLSTLKPLDFDSSDIKRDHLDEEWNIIADNISNSIRILLKRDQSVHNSSGVQTLYRIVLLPLESGKYTEYWRLHCANAIQFTYKTKRFSNEHIVWLQKSLYFDHMMELLKLSLKVQQYEVSNCMLSVIIELLCTMQQKSEVFLDHFVLNDGYAHIQTLLVAQTNIQIQESVLNSLLRLAFIGTDDLLDNLVEIDRESPFQRNDFDMPIKEETYLFRNLNNLKLYMQFYLSVADADDHTTQITNLLARQLYDVIQMNPLNYFLICGNSNIIFQVIEHLDSFTLDMKNSVFAILRHITIVLKYVPFKELSLLFVHFHGASSSNTIKSTINFCDNLLDLSPSWNTTFQELGLMNTFTSMIYFISKFYRGESYPETTTATTFEGGAFVVSDGLLENFTEITHFLTKLITPGLPLGMFREKVKDGLFVLVQKEHLSFGVTNIWKKLIITTNAENSTSLIENIELIDILKALKTCGSIDLKIQLLQFLQDIIVDYPKIQVVIGNLQVFDGLQWAMESVSLDEAESDKVLLLFDGWFKTVLSLIQNCDQNEVLFKDFATEPIFFSTLQRIFDKIGSVVFEGLFHLALDFKFYQVDPLNSNNLEINNSQANAAVVKREYIFPIIINLLKDMEDETSSLTISVLNPISYLLNLNKQNQVALCNSAILESLLLWITKLEGPIDFENTHQLLLNQGDNSQKLKNMLTKLLKQLTTMGMSDSALRICLSKVIGASKLTEPFRLYFLDLILHTLSFGRSPCYFHFEPPHTGQPGRIVLEDYGRSFPPQGGYTFMAWIRVEKYDKLSDIDIMTIAEPNNTERLRVYIDRHRMGLTLKTLKGKCDVEGFVISEKAWYHIGIVHHKPLLSASSVEVYANGTLVFSDKCNYLGHPGSIPAVKTYLGSRPEISKNPGSYIFNLGPTYFIEETVLEAQSISVIYDIGFEYIGNWQGSWEPYLIGNNKLQSKSNKILEGEAGSPLFNQLATFALSPTKSQFVHLLGIPEDQFLFSIIAKNNLDYIPKTTLNELMSSKFASDITSMKRKGIVNGSNTKPTLSTEKSTIGKIEGDVLTVCPKRIIEGIWTLGGCAILLKLVEESKSSEELHRTLSILVQSVIGSWRNLAEMERNQMYEILSFIIKSKKDLVTIATLDVILSLVGRSLDNSNDATIGNQPALRHLVLDIEMWRAPEQFQRYYMNQLSDLIVHSSHREENIATLNRMAIIKRFLMMIGNQIIVSDLLPELVLHIKIILKSSWTTEVIKMVCTFMINTIPKDSEPSELRRESDTQKSLPTPIYKLNSTESSKTYLVLARNLMLAMLVDITAENGKLNKFNTDLVNAVTIRWVMLFMSPRLNNATVNLAVKLFYNVWYSDENPGSKYRESFSIMNHLIQSRYYLVPLYLPLWGILCGTDIDPNHWNVEYKIPNLMAILKPSGAKGIKRQFCFEVAYTILGLTNNCIKTLSKHSVEINSKRGDNPDIKQGSDSNLTELSEIVQTSLEFIGAMYLPFDQMKEAFGRQDLLDILVHNLFDIICNDPVSSIESELSNSKKGGDFDNFHLFTSNLTDIKEPFKVSMTFCAEGTLQPYDNIECVYLLTSKSSNDESRFQLSAVDYIENMPALKESVFAILQLIMIVTTDSVLGTWKPISALDMILKAVPPTSRANLSAFQEFIILCVMNAVSQKIQKRKSIVNDTKNYQSLQKFTSLVVDMVYQGSFAKRHEYVLDFALLISQISIELEDENSKTGNKSDFIVQNYFKQLNRILMYCIGKMSSVAYMDVDYIIFILRKVNLYQNIFLNLLNNDADYIKCFVLHLFNCISHNDERVRSKAIEVWKFMLVQKPVQIANMLRTPKGPDYKELVDGFSRILQPEGEVIFSAWINQRREELKSIFEENAQKAWEDFKSNETKTTKDQLIYNQKQREFKLKKMEKKSDLDKQIYARFMEKSKAWVSDCQKTEIMKRQKYKTDYILMQKTLESEWRSLVSQLGREKAILGSEEEVGARWKLDFTEAKARIRKKIRKDPNTIQSYQSKAEKILENVTQIDTGVDLPILAKEGCNSPDKCSPINENSAIATGGTKSMSIIADSEIDIDYIQKLKDGPETIDEYGLGDQLEILKGTAEFEKATESQNSPVMLKKDSDLKILTKSTESLELNENIEKEWEEVKLEETQNAKIQRLLQPGDHILEIFNCARLIGLELIEGIALICKNNLYIIDNYFKQAEGEIIDIDEATLEERNIYHLIVCEPGRKPGENPLKVQTAGERHGCRQCAYEDIKEVHTRLYLFRNVALEMFLSDGRTFFLTFWNAKSRDSVYTRLLSKAQVNDGESVSGITTSGGPSVLSTAIFGGSPLNELTQKWVSREISNLAYLMHLNTLAGRSYNDLTQYHTFPWVLADYESEIVNLDDPKMYRDLSLPMGGQGAARAAQFEERYSIWDETVPACHYGTHYSSSMIVCSYLIRMEPFTEQYLKLQGGHFDHADRIFHSIPQSWASASRLNTTDVRELIPEFFYLPNFLENQNKFNFGTKQTGEQIDTVVLPNWAHGNPRLFIQIHRQALESEHVSNNLHKWIDLIFGYKQQGEEAAKALNLFHYLSYEGAVDIDKIADPIEKQATIGIIHNFGQTPKQLFKRAHPKRGVDPNEGQYKLEKHFALLTRSINLLKDLQDVPSDIRISSGGQLLAVGSSKLLIPPTFIKYIEWGHLDNSLRIVQADNQKVLAVFESIHIGQISSVCFVDQDSLVTGSEDTTVCIWSFTNSKKPALDLQACLRGHRTKITKVVVSRSFSIVVSGSEDGVCIIWDLNRHDYVRSLLGHDEAISCISVNNNTGDIITSDKYQMRLWDVNGCLINMNHQLLSRDIITVCEPYEGKASHMFHTELIFTGHQSGKIRIWRKVFDKDNEASPWKLTIVHTLDGIKNSAPVQSLYFSPNARFLLSADQKGKISSWVLPDGSGTEIHFSNGDSCTSCQTKFAVLGRRANCKCCGGTFCLTCTEFNTGYRLCQTCMVKISKDAPP
ncbi:hypothetical protein BC833DRAFT_552950 [Globomyces pollinis-pini]|nr:hypothetical protein BC833DRAFT_552950 [Globomyces pollinis-pini]